MVHLKEILADRTLVTTRRCVNWSTRLTFTSIDLNRLTKSNSTYVREIYRCGCTVEKLKSIYCIAVSRCQDEKISVRLQFAHICKEKLLIFILRTYNQIPKCVVTYSLHQLGLSQILRHVIEISIGALLKMRQAFISQLKFKTGIAKRDICCYNFTTFTIKLDDSRQCDVSMQQCVVLHGRHLQFPFRL